MNFKKLLVTTVLVTTQVAMVMPAASAEEVIHGTVIESSNPTSTGTNVNRLDDVLSVQQPNDATKPTTDPNSPLQAPTEKSPQDGSSPQTEGKDPATKEGNNSNIVNPNDPTTNGNTDGSQTPSSPSSTDGSSDNSEVNSDQNSTGQLILMVNSNLMYQGGQEYKASEPMTVKKGVSYVAIRSLVNRVGLSISYDSRTKETVIQRGADELRFKLNSSTYKVNGVVKTMKGKSYSTKKNVFMVPLTSITQALDLKYKVEPTRVVVNISTKPIAKFTVGPKEIIAGETQVTYQTESSSPMNLPIVQEEWNGREDIFANPGSYVVTYRVQDASGQWSDPYSLTIEVSKPHTPPVAAFTTDKDTYKMGELITYTDQSTDEVGIENEQWENKKLAFFTPGVQTIRLKVTNKFGLSSTVEKTVTITNETLYSETDFNKLFTPVGEKYTFAGSTVPLMDKVKYSFTTEPVTLIRSNSPETNYVEGILYRDTTIGKARFMVHHLNAVGKDVKLYVIATNTNSTPVNIYQENMGFAGPNSSPEATGKIGLLRYFTSMQTRANEKDTTVGAGESKVIFPELSATKMKQGEVVSMLSDIYTSSPIQFDVIMIDASKDPLKTLPQLGIIPRDGVHNRGTFTDATRIIQYDEVVGNKPSRLLIGDNDIDPFQKGVDAPYYTEERNLGNFGVIYKIRMSRVAPHTLITFNPRGGSYTGSIMVNGNIVGLPTVGGLSAPNDTNVLYRTGDQEESVDFVFTPSPGSNLAVNLIFEPLPSEKTQK